MKLTVNLDRDEDGVWIVECPSIPGCLPHVLGGVSARVRPEKKHWKTSKKRSNFAWKFERNKVCP